MRRYRPLAGFSALLLAALLSACDGPPRTATPAPVQTPPAWQPAALTAQLDVLVAAAPGSATLYAGGDRLYRSTDGGKTWAALPGDFPVAAFAVAPSDPRILVAAEPADCGGGPPGALHRSTDGGQTWQTRSPGASVLDIDPANPDHLFAIRCDGLYGSTDAGQTWQRVPGTPGDDRRGLFLIRGVSDPDYLYAVYGSTLGTVTIQRSPDGGRTWQTTTNEYPLQPTGFAVDPQDPTHAYLADEAGFYTSVDGGVNWRLRVHGLYFAEGRVLIGSLALDAVSPPPAMATLTLYLLNYQPGNLNPRPAQLSRWNGVNTWDPIAPLPPDQTIHRMLVVNDRSGPILVAATDHGILRLPLPLP
jgi:photosystem II stability/assembly factor-like uncharacterized protein